MSKNVLYAMLDELNYKIAGYRKALKECVCDHENLSNDAQDKIFKAYIIMCYHE